MAFYSYYQSQYPYWGQQQYANQPANQAFIAPPVPSYQPQPSWTGQDYYSAHYGPSGASYENDVGLFDYIWGRVKSVVGVNGSGHAESRHWHHRVYGGQVDITTLLPRDLGAAAGYEALRIFNYHRTIYRQPLMDDREREEEALAGLAIAEATKLWSYCQRPHDKYGRREACEVAASTAERLFRRARRRERERERDGYDYDDSRSVLGDDYSSSDSETRRQRRLRRRRRSSAGLGYGAAGAQMIPTPTSPYLQAGYGAQLPQAGAYGLSPNRGGLAIPNVNYQAVQQPYVGSYTPATSYSPTYPTAGGLAIPQTGRPRASSFGYPQSPASYY